MTIAGFEPARAEPSSLVGNRYNQLTEIALMDFSTIYLDSYSFKLLREQMALIVN